jgi:hypothetical protein
MLQRWNMNDADERDAAAKRKAARADRLAVWFRSNLPEDRAGIEEQRDVDAFRLLAEVEQL